MIGRDLKAALDTLGWSQAEFARRIDVHPNTVSAWVNDKPSISGPALAFLKLTLAVERMAAEVLG
jgi:transcriptional regulator with XRE-family HTH domain